MKRYLTYLFCLALSVANIHAQNSPKMSTKEQLNPLLCNPQTGICEMPDNEKNTNQKVEAASSKPIRIVYFTDPICSSCWGIEPQLRKLKLEYGKNFEIEYRMGGLLPDWSYNSGGISKPSDVAHHWDEVSQHYQMPIDGDVWLEDPLSSSYPPSIAFKAAQIQHPEKAIVFLRRIREMVFLEKKNITKIEHLVSAAEYAGLDINQFKADYEGKAKTLFEEDLALAKSLGVRGFPTVFFTDRTKNQLKVYGTRPYNEFEAAIINLFPTASKNTVDTRADALFAKYPTLCTREFAELSNISIADAEKRLVELQKSGSVKGSTSKNGTIWRLDKK
jgi:putative protein-disulfide isomerase